MKYFKSPKHFFVLIIALAVIVMIARVVDIATFRIESASAVVEAVDHEAPPAAPPGETQEKTEDVQSTVSPAHEEAHVQNDTPANDMPKVEGLPEKPEDQRFFSPSEVDVLQSLSGRRDMLDKREKDLASREALLKAGEQEIDKKVEELNRLKADMEKLLGQQTEEEEKQIGSLVKIYENMKPGDAARIFDTLEMRILLDVISRMKERKVSPILAQMSPEVAKNVTMQLAEQRKLPAAEKK